MVILKENLYFKQRLRLVISSIRVDVVAKTDEEVHVLWKAAIITMNLLSSVTNWLSSC